MRGFPTGEFKVAERLYFYTIQVRDQDIANTGAIRARLAEALKSAQMAVEQIVLTNERPVSELTRVFRMNMESFDIDSVVIGVGGDPEANRRDVCFGILEHLRLRRNPDDGTYRYFLSADEARTHRHEKAQKLVNERRDQFHSLAMKLSGWESETNKQGFLGRSS